MRHVLADLAAVEDDESDKGTIIGDSATSPYFPKNIPGNTTHWLYNPKLGPKRVSHGNNGIRSQYPEFSWAYT